MKTYLDAQAAGTSAENNLNLADYAVEILPKLCDKIEELELSMLFHQRQHAEAYRELVRLRERAR